jgi:hypothetical protein
MNREYVGGTLDEKRLVAVTTEVHFFKKCCKKSAL